MTKQTNTSNNDEHAKKLLWKGTLGEAIKLGKITQKEIDEWNNDDDIERAREQGYAKALADVEKWIDDLAKEGLIDGAINYTDLNKEIAKLKESKTSKKLISTPLADALRGKEKMK